MGGAMLLAVIGYLLFTIFLGSLMSAGPRGPASEPSDAFKYLFMISSLVEALACAAAIVGYVFLMLGPNRRAVLGLGIATVSVAGTHLLLYMIFKLPAMFGRAGPMGEAITPGGVFGLWFAWLSVQLLFVGELILFWLLMRATALNGSDRANADGAFLNMLLAGIYGGVRLVGFIFLFICVAQFRDAFQGLRGEPSKAMVWISIVFLWLGAAAFIVYQIFATLRIWNTRVRART
jgi:hypothetical protein